MPTPVAIWKNAPARVRVLLIAGVLVIASGLAWDVSTALRHRIGVMAFLGTCCDSLVRTVGIMAMGQWAARGWGTRIRQLRRQHRRKVEAVAGRAGECTDG